MVEIKEHDGMICRNCGNEERASEGYPCANCGTFLCLICFFKGIELCKACQALLAEKQSGQNAPGGAS